VPTQETKCGSQSPLPGPGVFWKQSSISLHEKPVEQLLSDQQGIRMGTYYHGAGVVGTIIRSTWVAPIVLQESSVAAPDL
jgi:hypothetical protein